LKHLFFFLSCSLFLLACLSKSDNQTEDYSKGNIEKLDFFGNYLIDDNNVEKKEYKSFFFDRYQSLLEQSKVDSAGQILGIVGRTLNHNAINDSQINRTSLAYIKKYENQISKERMSEILYNIGNYYYYSNAYDSSIFFFNKALTNTQTYEGLNRDGMVNYYLLFSTLNNGGQDSSIKFAHKSLKLFEKIKDTSMIGAVYSGIACIYNFQYNYSKALKYEQKAYDMARKSKDTSVIMVVSYNKINSYNTFGHANLLPFIDSTYEYYKVWSERNLTKNKVEMNSWLALKAVRENKLSLAKRLLDDLKPKMINIRDNVSENYYLNALAEYDVKAGANPENVKIYKTKIAEKIENEDYLSLSLYYEILHDYALKKNNFKEALRYLNDAQVARDSLVSTYTRSKVLEYEEKYQAEKKEQQIALQESQLARKNSYIALLVTILAGLLLASFTFYMWNRQKRLRQEKDNSMNFTRQLLQSTEEERKRIAGDLHDSISHELLNLKSIFVSDISKVNSKIDTIINDIRGISRNLHPVMFDKIGLVPNVEQLLERVQDQNGLFVTAEIKYSGSLSSADELQVYRIIQEAITNVIKYSKAHAAKVSIVEDDNFINVVIKDNGVGFNVKEALNSAKAFGLHNIIERSRVIGGEANITSGTDGTIVNIKIESKP
jgi:two-component system, NarL family, sensor kinase